MSSVKFRKMTSIRNLQRISVYSSIKMPSPFVNKDVEDIVCSTVQLLTNNVWKLVFYNL